MKNASPMLRNATTIYPILNDWKISITFNPEKNAKVGRNINKVPMKELRHEITKNIVRYHYLIRDIKKSKKEDLERYSKKQAIWETLDETTKEDLRRFLIYDDLGKGKKRRD